MKQNLRDNHRIVLLPCKIVRHFAKDFVIDIDGPISVGIVLVLCDALCRIYTQNLVSGIADLHTR